MIVMGTDATLDLALEGVFCLGSTSGNEQEQRCTATSTAYLIIQEGRALDEISSVVLVDRAQRHEARRRPPGKGHWGKVRPAQSRGNAAEKEGRSAHRTSAERTVGRPVCGDGRPRAKRRSIRKTDSFSRGRTILPPPRRRGRDGGSSRRRFFGRFASVNPRSSGSGDEAFGFVNNGREYRTILRRCTTPRRAPRASGAFNGWTTGSPNINAPTIGAEHICHLGG